MVVDAVNRIRELEKTKEREIQEAKREAARILAESEVTIASLRSSRIQEAEEKAAKIRDDRIREVKKEAEKIEKDFEEQAGRLRKKLEGTVDQAVAFLLEQLGDQHGD